MIRRIYCQPCAERKGIDGFLTEEDRRVGYKERRQWISAQKPPNHTVTINGNVFPVELQCDDCSKVVDGEVSLAVTLWKHKEFPKGEPEVWECQFGNLLPPSAVKLIENLQKDS